MYVSLLIFLPVIVYRGVECPCLGLGNPNSLAGATEPRGISVRQGNSRSISLIFHRIAIFCYPSETAMRKPFRLKWFLCAPRPSEDLKNERFRNSMGRLSHSIRSNWVKMPDKSAPIRCLAIAFQLRYRKLSELLQDSSYFVLNLLQTQSSALVITLLGFSMDSLVSVFIIQLTDLRNFVF